MSVDQDKLAFVTAFLDRTIGAFEPFEVTPGNVDKLFQICQRNILLNKIAAEERNDNRIR